ncbi:MAG: hypothetical protein AAFV43_02060 [Planctomycetota bacterium]
MSDARTPTRLDAARRDYHQLRSLLVALLVVACATPLSLNLVDPDLWGHVRYAQDWLAEGELPRTATHTYTAVGHPWVNHENLAELLLAGGFATIGATGVLIAKCLLGMAILGMMWLAARRQGVRPIAAWALFLLVAHNLHAFFPLRPQLLSFLWCAVMLLALERAFAGWGNRRADFINTRRKADEDPIDWRWLAALPVLMAVWANSHGGFVAGLAIGLALLGGRALELVVRRRPDAWRHAGGLALVGLAMGAATLATPYGYELHGWMLGSLGVARPEITEWGPPLPGNPVFWPFVGLVIVAIGSLVFTDRKRDVTKVVILALVAWQAATHLRHIAFFALLCGFWLPTYVQSIASRLRRQAAAGLPVAGMSTRMRAIGVTGLALAIGLQTLVVGRRLAELPVARSQYPVDAIQWLADQNPSGRLLVNFNWAQYAIAALAPDVRVAFDGRFRTCYPQAVIDRHFDFLLADTWPRSRDVASGPIAPAATLAVDTPDYVLIERGYETPVRVMREAASGESPTWSLVYQDALAQVWGRAAVVDDPESSRYIAEDWRLVSDHASNTCVPWPALPRDLGPRTDPSPPTAVAHAPSEPRLEDEG